MAIEHQRAFVRIRKKLRNYFSRGRNTGGQEEVPLDKSTAGLAALIREIANVNDLKFCIEDQRLGTKDDFIPAVAPVVWFAGNTFMEATGKTDGVIYDEDSRAPYGVSLDVSEAMGSNAAMMLFVADAVIQVGQIGARSELVPGHVDLKPLVEGFKSNVIPLINQSRAAPAKVGV